MSEAMSSVEIEDVLSSIRRLVSEDLRPGLKAAAPVKAEEKLMLTSALRVVSEKDVPSNPAPALPPEPAAKAALPRLHLGVAPSADEMVFRMGKAVEEQDVEWESEVGDPQPQVARMEWTEDGWAAIEEGVETAQAPVVASQLIAEPEADLEQEAAEHEVPAWAQTEPEAELDADLAEMAEAEPTVFAAGPDDQWADRAEAAVLEELRDTRPPEHDAPLSDEMTFDEQVLRDLVRDLIREELQGALGERITRNVRKLVRAEIARVIASQDLE